MTMIQIMYTKVKDQEQTIYPFSCKISWKLVEQNTIIQSQTQIEGLSAMNTYLQFETSHCRAVIYPLLRRSDRLVLLIFVLSI